MTPWLAGRFSRRTPGRRIRIDAEWGGKGRPRVSLNSDLAGRRVESRFPRAEESRVRPTGAVRHGSSRPDIRTPRTPDRETRVIHPGSLRLEARQACCLASFQPNASGHSSDDSDASDGRYPFLRREQFSRPLSPSAGETQSNGKHFGKNISRRGNLKKRSSEPSEIRPAAWLRRRPRRGMRTGGPNCRPNYGPPRSRPRSVRPGPTACHRSPWAPFGRFGRTF